MRGSDKHKCQCSNAAPRATKLAGAIAGRALYDGRIDPAVALALIRNARAAA